jgi:hypothetical protein
VLKTLPVPSKQAVLQQVVEPKRILQRPVTVKASTHGNDHHTDYVTNPSIHDAGFLNIHYADGRKLKLVQDHTSSQKGVGAMLFSDGTWFMIHSQTNVLQQFLNECKLLKEGASQLNKDVKRTYETMGDPLLVFLAGKPGERMSSLKNDLYELNRANFKCLNRKSGAY